MSHPNSKVPYVKEEDYRKNEDAYKKTGAVIIPDSDEAQEILDRITCKNRCGECRHFDIQLGQKEIYETKFVLQLIKEREMGSMASAHQWNGFGICHYWSGGSDDYHLTHVFAPARINRWKIEGSKVDYHRKDDSVECPYYEPQKGKNIRSYRMTHNSKTIGT